VRFTFVHAADLHLASPFQGLAMAAGEHQAIVEQLREATFAAFERLVELCIERQAQFLLLAGDLFDDEECSVRDLFRFRDGLARLAEAGIEVFAIYGNHDPFEGKRPRVPLPDNTHVFDSEVAATVPVGTVPGVTVTGISYRTSREARKLARQYVCRAEPGFHIGLLHADVGGNANSTQYAACSVEQLRDAGFHYWALGHIHERRTFSTDPVIAYSGNIQGRNPNETGERGALVVEADTDTGQATPEFVPLQEVRWEQADVSIAGLESLDALEDRLTERIDQMAEACRPSSLVLRLRLTERGPLNTDLQRENAAADLCERLRLGQVGTSPFVWLESIRLACGSDIDFAARREGDDLAAEVLRRADALADNQSWFDETLGGLFGHYRAKKVLDPLPPETRAQLLREASERCVEALDEEA
jgi:DNA repair exonuclease SbcCD nuclease subunit